jgi:hypothetical protein
MVKKWPTIEPSRRGRVKTPLLGEVAACVVLLQSVCDMLKHKQTKKKWPKERSVCDIRNTEIKSECETLRSVWATRYHCSLWALSQICQLTCGKGQLHLQLLQLLLNLLKTTTGTCSPVGKHVGSSTKPVLSGLESMSDSLSSWVPYVLACSSFSPFSSVLSSAFLSYSWSMETSDHHQPDREQLTEKSSAATTIA